MYQIVWKLIPRRTSPGSSFWLLRNSRTIILAPLLAGVAVILAVACGAAAPVSSPTPAAPSVLPTAPPTPESRLKVVTTTTILADLVSNVGGDRVEVTSIVPPGAEPHLFQINPSHSLAISQADVIVSNGFGLDDFLEPVLTGAKQAEAAHVVAAQGLEAAPVAEIAFPGESHEHEREEEELAKGIKEIIHKVEGGKISATAALEQVEGLLGSHEYEQESAGMAEPAHGAESLRGSLTELIHEVKGGHLVPEAAIQAIEEMLAQHEGEEPGHEHRSGDPHFWQNPLFTAHYVERIRDSLVQADPANAEVYGKNAAKYTQQLQDLDQEIAQTLSQVPPERRHLVTFHDAFGYFARRYGWRVSAFVPVSAGEVTPEKVVSVIKVIKAEGIPAVFAEPQFRQDVLEQAARDTGIRVGTIYSDSLDDKVSTYIEMMRFNAKSLSEHLQ
jgi:ABC-type Zn uptake system ZnuABC Zn-binding protein ZnuA